MVEGPFQIAWTDGQEMVENLHGLGHVFFGFGLFHDGTFIRHQQLVKAEFRKERLGFQRKLSGSMGWRDHELTSGALQYTHCRGYFGYT
jgi:hypothetical protein